MQTILLLLAMACTSASAQVAIPVQVRLAFDEAYVHTVIPGPSPMFRRVVHYLNEADQERRIEFLGEKGEPAPFISTTIHADILPTGGGQVVFRFHEPLSYDFIDADEVTGRVFLRSGVIREVHADLPMAEAVGFQQIIAGAPTTAYVEKSQLKLVNQIANIHRLETPQEITTYPWKEDVPGLTLTGRRGLAPLLVLDPNEIPQLYMPVAIPLKIMIHPVNNFVTGVHLLGGPVLRTVGAITWETVGLDQKTALNPNLPKTFARIRAEMQPVDLQDASATHFVEGRAELLRLSAKIQEALTKRFQVDAISSSSRAFLSGQDNQDEFSRFPDCISLLDGRKVD